MFPFQLSLFLILLNAKSLKIEYDSNIEEEQEVMMLEALAVLMFEEEDFVGAVEGFTRAISIDPNPNLFLRRSDSNMMLGNLDQSLEDLNTALILTDPFDDELIISIYFRRATVLKSMNEFIGSVNDYSQLIDLSWKLGSTNKKPLIDLSLQYNLRGLCYVELGHYDEAESDFTQSINLNPGIGLYYLNRGGLRVRLGKFIEASSDYSRSIELGEDSAYLYRGSLYFEIGLYWEAVEDFSTLVRLGHRDREIFEYRGLSYFYLELFQNCISDLTICFELESDHADDVANNIVFHLYRYRGISHFYEMNFIESIEDINIFISMSPKVPEDYRDLVILKGVSFMMLESLESSINEYSNAIEFDSNGNNKVNSGSLFLLRGIAYFMMDEAELALSDFDRSVELEDMGIIPSFSLLLRGVSLYHSGKYEETIRDCTSAISKYHGEVPFDLVESLISTKFEYGMVEMISKIVSKIFFLTGDGTSFRDDALFLAFVFRGRSFIQLQDFERAVYDYAEVINLHPTPKHYQTRGICYQHLGDHRNAILDFDSAIKLQPNEPEFYFHRGRSLSGLSMFEEAISDFLEVIDLGFGGASKFRVFKSLGIWYHLLYNYEMSSYYFRLSSVWEDDVSYVSEEADVLLDEYFQTIGEEFETLPSYPSRPPNKTSELSVILGVEKKMDLGFYSEVVRDMSKNPKILKYDPHSLIKRGLAYEALGNFELSMEDYNRAFYSAPIHLNKKDPDFKILVLTCRANLLCKMEQFEESMIDLLYALEILDGSKNEQLRVYLEGRVRRCLDLFQLRLLRGYRNNENTEEIFSLSEEMEAKSRGFNLHSSGDIKNAILEYSRSIEMNSNNFEIFILRGKAFLDSEMSDFAVVDFNRALEILRTGVSYTLDILRLLFASRGEVYENLGRIELAVEEFEIAAKLDDTNTYHYYKLVELYATLGNITAVISNLEKLISLDPSNYLHYFQRAMSYFRLGELENAHLDVRTLIELKPFPQYYPLSEFDTLVLKETIQMLGEILTQKEVVLVNEFEEYVNLIGVISDDEQRSVYRAKAFFKARYNEQAIVEISDAIEIRPDPFYFFLRGLSWYEIGEYDVSIEDFTSSIQTDPTSSLVFELRADSYKKLNRFEECVNDMESAIELNPSRKVILREKKKDCDERMNEYYSKYYNSLSTFSVEFFKEIGYTFLKVFLFVFLLFFASTLYLYVRLSNEYERNSFKFLDRWDGKMEPISRFQFDKFDAIQEDISDRRSKSHAMEVLFNRIKVKESVKVDGKEEVNLWVVKLELDATKIRKVCLLSKEGGYARTYKCEVDGLENEVVLKIRKEERFNSFEDEVARKESIHLPYHKNIAQILSKFFGEFKSFNIGMFPDYDDFWRKEHDLRDDILNRPVLVMKFYNKDLERYFMERKRCRMKFRDLEVCYMLKGMIEGVKFLNENRIVHRDLHPGNIFIDESNGRIWIGDFGMILDLRRYNFPQGYDRKPYLVLDPNDLGELELMKTDYYSFSNPAKDGEFISLGGCDKYLPPELKILKEKDHGNFVEKVDFRKSDVFGIGTIAKDLKRVVGLEDNQRSHFRALEFVMEELTKEVKLERFSNEEALEAVNRTIESLENDYRGAKLLGKGHFGKSGQPFFFFCTLFSVLMIFILLMIISTFISVLVILHMEVNCNSNFVGDSIFYHKNHKTVFGYKDGIFSSFNWVNKVLHSSELNEIEHSIEELNYYILHFESIETKDEDVKRALCEARRKRGYVLKVLLALGFGDMVGNVFEAEDILDRATSDYEYVVENQIEYCSWVDVYFAYTGLYEIHFFHGEYRKAFDYISKSLEHFSSSPVMLLLEVNHTSYCNFDDIWNELLLENFPLSVNVSSLLETREFVGVDSGGVRVSIPGLSTLDNFEVQVVRNRTIMKFVGESRIYYNRARVHLKLWEILEAIEDLTLSLRFINDWEELLHEEPVLCEMFISDLVESIGEEEKKTISKDEEVVAIKNLVEMLVETSKFFRDSVSWFSWFLSPPPKNGTLHVKISSKLSETMIDRFTSPDNSLYDSEFLYNVYSLRGKCFLYALQPYDAIHDYELAAEYGLVSGKGGEVYYIWKQIGDIYFLLLRKYSDAAEAYTIAFSFMEPIPRRYDRPGLTNRSRGAEKVIGGENSLSVFVKKNFELLMMRGQSYWFIGEKENACDDFGLIEIFVLSLMKNGQVVDKELYALVHSNEKKLLDYFLKCSEFHYRERNDTLRGIGFVDIVFEYMRSTGRSFYEFDSHQAYYLRGRINIGMGRFEEAIEDLTICLLVYSWKGLYTDMSLSLDEIDSVLFHRGWAYILDGDVERGQDNWSLMGTYFKLKVADVLEKNVLPSTP